MTSTFPTEILIYLNVWIAIIVIGVLKNEVAIEGIGGMVGLIFAFAMFSYSPILTGVLILFNLFWIFRALFMR